MKLVPSVRVAPVRYIKRRADMSPAEWAVAMGQPVPPVHVVEPDAAGFFAVTSDRSDAVYRVNTDGECSCFAWAEYGNCAHLQAVLVHAADIMGRVR